MASQTTINIWTDRAETPEEREIVRHNWRVLGLEYWFTDYNKEHWRDPATGECAAVLICHD
jgi:hypothetical protein